MIRLLLIAAILLIPEVASAATDLHNPSETYSALLRMVRDEANLWSDRLRLFAVSVFWSLATIQLVLTMGPLVARNAEGSAMLYEFAWYLIKTIFFYTLLDKSVWLGTAIVNTFRQAGAQAAGVGVSLQPGDMIDLAVSMADTIGSVSTYNPAEAFNIVFASFVILFCFGFIAAYMGLTIIESYVVINAAMGLMGFAGAQVTREYALAMVRYAIVVGVKLFILTLIVGIVMGSAKSWQAAYTHDNASTLTIVLMSLICAIFAKQVPDFVGSMISGVSPGGGGAIGGVAAAGMAFGAAAYGAIANKIATSNIMGGGSGGGLASSIASSLTGGSGGSGGGSSAPSGPVGKPPSAPSGGGAKQGVGTPPTGGSGGAAKKAFSAAHATTAGAARTVGVISAITVPGMSQAADMSLGPSPVPPSYDSPPAPSASEPEQTPENVIRPEEPSKIEIGSNLNKGSTN